MPDPQRRTRLVLTINPDTDVHLVSGSTTITLGFDRRTMVFIQAPPAVQIRREPKPALPDGPPKLKGGIQ